MATYNFTDGTVTAHPKSVDTLPNTGGPFVRTAVIDFSKQNLDSGNNDVAQIINIPANTWVLGVFARLITVETDDAEMEIGYGSDDAFWTDTIAEIDAGAGTGTILTNNFDTPLYFAAADTIDIVNNNNDVDYDTCKVEVNAVMLSTSPDDALGSVASTL
jgi:hypothetical protein